MLKKLRETAFSEQSPLHKRTMQFAYSEKDALPSLDGWGLEQAMRRYVEGSMEEYAKKKLDLVKTVGYEDGYAIFDITMSLPPTYGTNIQEYLVDLSLGLVPHLEITHGQIKDYRFRIPAPEPSKVLGKGTLAFFNQPKGKATLRLSTPDGKRQLALEPDVYFPEGISPEIMEPDLRKVRLALPFFNIVIWPDKRATFQFTQLDITEEYDIHSLQTLANLTLFLHEATQRYTHVNFQVNVKSLKVGFGQMEVSQLFDVDTIRFIATIDDGMKIAKYFDLPQDTKLKPAELWQQRDQLLLMTVATGLKQGVLRLSFWMEDTITDKEKERCIPFVTIVTLGPYRVVIAAAILGRLEPKDEFREKHREVEIIVNRIEVCRTYRYDHEETDVPSVRELIESVTHDFEDSHDIVLLEEFVH